MVAPAAWIAWPGEVLMNWEGHGPNFPRSGFGMDGYICVQIHLIRRVGSFCLCYASSIPSSVFLSERPTTLQKFYGPLGHGSGSSSPIVIATLYSTVAKSCFGFRDRKWIEKERSHVLQLLQLYATVHKQCQSQSPGTHVKRALNHVTPPIRRLFSSLPVSCF
jgi:hypothetical protein